MVRFGELNLFFGGVQAVLRRGGRAQRRRRPAAWRRGGERVRRALAALGALRWRSRRCARGGCGGGIKAPDLFIVQRTGGAPRARLTLLVNEEGGVQCNGRPRR